MVDFHDLCLRNCAIRYVGGVLELRKLNFRGSNANLMSKKLNFRRLIAKIGHYRLILASKPTYDPFSWNMS